MVEFGFGEKKERTEWEGVSLANQAMRELNYCQSW